MFDRHRDGRWVAADEMPRTADGRPLSYIAINGHGSYPRAGFIPRIFLAFNDRTGKGGKVDQHSTAYLPGLHAHQSSDQRLFSLSVWCLSGCLAFAIQPF